MNLQAIALPRPGAASAGVFVSCLAAVAMVGWMSVTINRDRACALGESVAERWCTPAAPGSLQEADALRKRIDRNPGDANAYGALALADQSPARPQLIAIASQLAPRNPNLMLQQAAAALERQDWASAVPPLVGLVEYHNLPVAAGALAWLVQNGQVAFLEPYIVPGSQWLARLLWHMRARNDPFSGVLPLVTRAARLGVLDADALRNHVRDLKAAGAWADAYALWLSMHGKSVPLLFNASFDHAFEQDGFDWEAPASLRRPGVIVERRRAEQRGAVLDLQFTGRAISVPIVRQYLFIAPGRYRLRGDYLARQFRMEEGLRWVLRCSSSSSAGASAPLQDTQGVWRTFEFDIAVPRDCGIVAALQLETATPANAALSGRGRVSFDAFSLEWTSR